MKSLKLFAVVLIAAQLLGCAAYKAARQQKKDDKLFSKVVANDRVIERAANVYNSLHPIDQKVILIPGKDSIIIDSIPYDRVRDSIIMVQCPTLNLDSLKITLIKTVTKIRTDTLLIPDTSTLRRLGAVQANLNNLQGKYEQQTIQTAQEKKRGNKWLWFFIGACAVIVIENGLLLYNFLRPKIK